MFLALQFLLVKSIIKKFQMLKLTSTGAGYNEITYAESNIAKKQMILIRSLSVNVNLAVSMLRRANAHQVTQRNVSIILTSSSESAFNDSIYHTHQSSSTPLHKLVWLITKQANYQLTHLFDGDRLLMK